MKFSRKELNIREKVLQTLFLASFPTKKYNRKNKAHFTDQYTNIPTAEICDLLHKTIRLRFYDIELWKAHRRREKDRQLKDKQRPLFLIEQSRIVTP